VLVVLGALPFFLYVAVFLLLPIGVLAVEAFRATDPVTFEETWSTASVAAITQGPYRRAYVGSLQLSVITAVLGAVLGLALALAILRARVAGCCAGWCSPPPACWRTSAGSRWRSRSWPRSATPAWSPRC
jgi:ABC-type uncharacterized transport system, permease component